MATILRLPFDDPTPLADAGPLGLTVQSTFDPEFETGFISFPTATDQKRFGASAVEYGNEEDRVWVDALPALGTGDFTIEGWYSTAVGYIGPLFSLNIGGTEVLALWPSTVEGQSGWELWVNDALVAEAHGWAVPGLTSTEVNGHFALQRRSGVFELFVPDPQDVGSLASTYTPGAPIDIGISRFEIGYSTPYETGTSFAIYDDWRISDTAIYADGVYAVPTAAYPEEEVDPVDEVTFTLSAPGVLGATAGLINVERVALVAAPSVLGSPSLLVLHDFTGQLGDTLTRYVMDLVTPSGLVRVPISSWQATLQQGRANYVQCVVPGVAPWVATIGVATEFVLTRQAVLPDESVFEYEMARAPVGEARFDRGATNYTCTLSGYSPGFAVGEEPSGAAARVLTKVRSISSGSGGRRVRCAIDWLLRPGQLASFEGSEFTAAFINYYVQGRDAYMDVGERV
jgi:hypothetical protein